ncbi:glycosyltransferase [Pseudomonas sp. NPDC088444]|uniref:glycosyltransferase n=1 Tax=Pseudomonas sp. NPDC088444 TaxID=3364456 RepID=UPI00384C7C1F
MSSDFPKVAVLLAAYNGMAWIEEQLASILAQTGVNVDVYISVDPSSDGTEGWCAEFALHHKNVFLLPAAGPFKGAARNFFRLIRDVDLDGYDFISFSDQDDIWYPDKLARAVERLRTDDIDGYSSNVIAFWPNGRRMLVDKAQPQVQWDHLFEAAGPGCTYVLQPVLAAGFKQLIIDQWDKVQEVALHDWFCYAFARSHGFKWFIDPVPGMDYRQHARNQVGVNAGLKSGFSRFRRLVDGWWFDQAQLLSILTGRSNNPITDSRKRAFFAGIAIHSMRYRRRRRDQLMLMAVGCISWFGSFWHGR